MGAEDGIGLKIEGGYQLTNFEVLQALNPSSVRALFEGLEAHGIDNRVLDRLVGVLELNRWALATCLPYWFRDAGFHGIPMQVILNQAKIHAQELGERLCITTPIREGKNGFLLVNYRLNEPVGTISMLAVSHSGNSLGISQQEASQGNPGKVALDLTNYTPDGVYSTWQAFLERGVHLASYYLSADSVIER